MLDKSRVWSLLLVSFLFGIRTYQHPLVVICKLSSYTVFSALSNKWHDLKKLLNIKCVLIPNATSAETFHILRRIKEGINVHTSSCKVPVIIVMF